MLIGAGAIELNAGRPVTVARVANTGDRPVQVGSHYHFAEANPALEFDREAAWGHRLAVPAGTAVRFEPGIDRRGRAGPLGGSRIVPGLRGESAGPLDAPDANCTASRYALLYGPTAGDRIRLADTNLLIEIERDLCAGGDEAVFGGGKVIRESMGQSSATRAEGAPDTVITGAVILDHWGIVKADIGIRDGRIVAIGKAGNPDTMDGVDPELVIGPSTEIIAGNGRILTAGAIDCHVHLICPQILDEALGSGITTLIGGGTGPAEGTKATTVTPGAWHLARMLEALDPWPVNVALLGKGNTISEEAMWEQLRAGAGGFKLHEDWGTTPAAIDACLRVADASGVQVGPPHRHAERGRFRRGHLSARSAAGRSTPTTPRAPAAATRPTSSRWPAQPNVLPSSTNPTRPYTGNTLAEHLDMLMVCHHLNSGVPEDLAFAESRIRPSTMAAEDLLHDLGAISMIGSDSQAMGRVGEVVLRTWQTAHVMKERRGPLPGDGAADNHRARRYVAKYTICPAVAHGLEDEVGSVEAGKLADLVLWEPAFFGVRPAPGHQGRHDRLGGDGRRQRLHPHPAAGAAPADVRRLRGGARPRRASPSSPRRPSRTAWRTAWA